MYFGQPMNFLADHIRRSHGSRRMCPCSKFSNSASPMLSGRKVKVLCNLAAVSPQELPERKQTHELALGIPVPGFEFRFFLLLIWLPYKGLPKVDMP